MKEKIEKFIKDNGLTFEKGSRNTDLVIICGFSQYIVPDDYNLSMVNEMMHPILEPYFKKDSELSTEYDRVCSYAWMNDYYKWWNDEDNRKMYKL